MTQSTIMQVKTFASQTSDGAAAAAAAAEGQANVWLRTCAVEIVTIQVNAYAMVPPTAYARTEYCHIISISYTRTEESAAAPVSVSIPRRMKAH